MITTGNNEMRGSFLHSSYFLRRNATIAFLSENENDVSKLSYNSRIPKRATNNSKGGLLAPNSIPLFSSASFTSCRVRCVETPANSPANDTTRK